MSYQYGQSLWKGSFAAAAAASCAPPASSHSLESGAHHGHWLGSGGSVDVVGTEEDGNRDDSGIEHRHCA